MTITLRDAPPPCPLSPVSGRRTAPCAAPSATGRSTSPPASWRWCCATSPTATTSSTTAVPARPPPANCSSPSRATTAPRSGPTRCAGASSTPPRPTAGAPPAPIGAWGYGARRKARPSTGALLRWWALIETGDGRPPGGGRRPGGGPGWTSRVGPSCPRPAPASSACWATPPRAKREGRSPGPGAARRPHEKKKKPTTPRLRRARGGLRRLAGPQQRQHLLGVEIEEAALVWPGAWNTRWVKPRSK